MPNENFKLKEFSVKNIYRNAAPARLYQEAVTKEMGSAISDKGALIVSSGAKTGRTPKDKRVVDHPESNNNIWWGDINIKLSPEEFNSYRKRAIECLNTVDQLYVVDGYAGWDPKYQIKVRVICTRAYHALFMHNMLIRPSENEIQNFGEPDYIIYNAGRFSARDGQDETKVCLSFENKELVILGTQYAGEMKKGIFTVMNYTMPREDILSMHCSANLSMENECSLFFGLSGTGKTTLSADANRKLIGDDEHCWTDDGIFNIEGGCYAKAIDLSPEKEPEIFNAIKFGTVLENVVYDKNTHEVDYSDTTLTENTRASYPIEFIPNIQMPCVGSHPTNIVFLTCDAFGVLPPVSKLSPEQAMYHFMSGYTAKVAGTEMGVTEPEATFSACFGAAFMVWHPSKYAQILSKRIQDNNTDVWLVNTGWSKGPYGVGQRISLKHTRSIITAINCHSLKNSKYESDPIFGFEIPQACQDVPSEILTPRNTWTDKSLYDQKRLELAKLFQENFKQFIKGSAKEIINAGPKL